MTISGGRAPLLEVRGLAVRFGGNQVLRGIDFALAEGELRCVIGPNGAGKSTFFKLLSGQLAPGGGVIRFAGRDLAGLRPAAIAALGLGLKTQVPSLFEGLSTRENLWLAARRRHGAAMAKAATAAMLTRLGIEHLAIRTADRLGHGERQRLELGVVLIGEPRLILLDEPTAGATIAEAERLADLIRTLAWRHAVIVVEHDMQVVRRLDAIITVLHQGAVLTEGPVQAVLADARVRDVYLGRHHHVRR
jgi:branched-chain amino acid transport system ATP-binding protein/urea transport system ATP-binding protein